MCKNILSVFSVLFLATILGCQNNSTESLESKGKLDKAGQLKVQTVHIMNATLLSVNGDQSSWRLTLFHPDSATLGTTSFQAIIELDDEFVDNPFGGYYTYNGEVGDTTIHDITLDACLPETFTTYDYRIQWLSDVPAWMDEIHKSAFHPNFQECANK